jgi:hypothetical protein
MKRVLLGAALAFLLPADVYAQRGRPCEPRVAVGVALSRLPIDAAVDPVLAEGGQNALAATAGFGPEVSVHTLVPISVNWNLTAEFGAGTVGVEVERDASGTDIPKRPAGHLSAQRLNIGLQHQRPGRYICVHGSIRALLYRFSYRGVATAAAGLSLMVGGEVPLPASIGLFFEIGLDAAVNDADPPLTPTPVVATLRPEVGLRFRF